MGPSRQLLQFGKLDLVYPALYTLPRLYAQTHGSELSDTGRDVKLNASLSLCALFSRCYPGSAIRRPRDG